MSRRLIFVLGLLVLFSWMHVGAENEIHDVAVVNVLLSEHLVISNSISLLIMLLSTVLSTFLLMNLTNRFKTPTYMKLSKTFKEDKKDESRRIIRK